MEKRQIRVREALADLRAGMKDAAQMRIDLSGGSGVITTDLVNTIRKQYVLNWHGIHGIDHFHRVRSIGLRLAAATGADERIVELFAFVHDARRFNDHVDPDHGPRAAQLVNALRNSFDFLSASDLDALEYACELHTRGLKEADVTVQTCWDSDRLDLGRAGIVPDATKLCTAAAREADIRDWAYKRSIGLIPE